jgi:hypothetical protein
MTQVTGTLNAGSKSSLAAHDCNSRYSTITEELSQLNKGDAKQNGQHGKTK